MLFWDNSNKANNNNKRLSVCLSGKKKRQIFVWNTLVTVEEKKGDVCVRARKNTFADYKGIRSVKIHRKL